MMKKYICLCIIAAAALLSGCKKSLEYRDVIYFTGSEGSPVTSMYLDGPSSMGFSVTSSCRAEEDITVTVAVDGAALEDFNRNNGTSYALLPESSYTISSLNPVIKGGSSVSEPFFLEINALDDLEEGVLYCLPMKITETSNGMEILEVSKFKYVTINQIITTKAAATANSTSGYTGNNYFTVPTMVLNENLRDLGVCTMECRVYMNAFYPANHNPGIATVMGQEERFLIRFGDISCDNDQIQIAGRGASLTSKSHFSTGRWYHVAAVDNGSYITLYVDGEVEGQINSSGKSAIDLGWDWEGGFAIGNSCGNRTMNGYFSEMRIWQRELSPVELKNNQCYVDPASPGLIAYWRFNGTDGTTVPDLTGHGYDAVAARAIRWLDNVKCPEIN